MSFYQGPATLLDGRGNESSAEIAITIDTSEALKSWSAQGSAGVGTWDLHEATTLRLPDGREGRVVVNSVRMSSSHPDSVSISILGNGEPPS